MYWESLPPGETDSRGQWKNKTQVQKDARGVHCVGEGQVGEAVQLKYSEEQKGFKCFSDLVTLISECLKLISVPSNSG